MFNARRRATADERQEPLVTYSRLPPDSDSDAAPSGDARVEPRLRVVTSREMVPVAPPVRDVSGFDGGMEPPPLDDLRLADDEPPRRRRARRGGHVFRFVMAIGLFAFLAGAGVLAVTFIGVLQTNPLPDSSATPATANVAPVDVTPAAGPDGFAAPDATAADTAPTDTAVANPEPSLAPVDEPPPATEATTTTAPDTATVASVDSFQPRGDTQPTFSDAQPAPQSLPSSDSSFTDPRFGSDTAAGPAMEGDSDADLLTARGRPDAGPDTGMAPVQPSPFATATGGSSSLPVVPSVDDPAPPTGGQRPFSDTGWASEPSAPSPAANAGAIPPAEMLPPSAGGIDDPAVMTPPATVMTPPNGEVIPVPPVDIPNVKKPTLRDRLRAWFGRPAG